MNRWLGGTRALLRRLPDLVGDPAAETLHLLDVGTGSGDLPLAIGARAPGRLRFTAVDAHAQSLAIARRRTLAADVDICRADGCALPFAAHAFDIVVLSLVLHHLEGEEPVCALAEAARVARAGVIVAELERSRPALLGARFLAATVWRGNRLTRHDGPLSVRRAFTAAELGEMARTAGLREVRVTRHPLFRLVLTARPPR